MKFSSVIATLSSFKYPYMKGTYDEGFYNAFVADKKEIGKVKKGGRFVLSLRKDTGDALLCLYSLPVILSSHCLAYTKIYDMSFAKPPSF